LQVKIRSWSPLAGVVLACALVAPAQAQEAATVSVRVEGERETLVSRTTVTTSTTPVAKAGNPCSGTSVGGALELATRGDWGGTYDASYGQTVVDVRGESHPFTSGRYWSIWVNGRVSELGVCARELGPGDEVLLFPDCFGPGCDPPEPLRAEVPNSARAGAPFTVRVVELPTGAPVADATVSGFGTSVRTNADGVATLTVTTPGTYALRVEAPGKVRTTQEVVVAATAAAPGPVPEPAPAPAPAPVPASAPAAPDRAAPDTRILRIAEGDRFSRARAPRTVRARVLPDPSGLARVELRLTRRSGRSCAYLSVQRERFIRARCGRGISYPVSDASQLSYLLPERLGPGRYVLDVVAVDRAGNRARLARGGTRVVFTVR